MGWTKGRAGDTVLGGKCSAADRVGLFACAGKGCSNACAEDKKTAS